jgi:hypothetical protein
MKDIVEILEFYSSVSPEFWAYSYSGTGTSFYTLAAYKPGHNVVLDSTFYINIG